MGYDTVGLTVSREVTERLEAENARRLLKNRKLSLILDLDQTIVHASWDQRVGDFIKEDTDIRQFNLPGSSVVYYIKLRPGLDHFLKEIEQLYELHIYTMGTRDYAEAVTNEIDPNGSLFKERILSRDESGSVTQKKLQRLFPCDTSMVVVLDDRSDVWSFSANLIRIKPYEFFVGTGDINCPFKKKVTPCSDKIVVAGNHYSAPSRTDDDNELYKMLNILKDVHKNFYDKDEHDKEADVTHIIPKMKLNVLQHVIITFTDVIPQIKDPTLSWIWQMATSFGATCSMDLTGKTTHLIAVKFSSKVKAAREYGHSIHVVTPAWLLDSTSSCGIDDIWDTDSDTVDSPLYNKSWKRKREQESGGESGGDASEDDNESITLAVRRQQRVNKRQKSQLSKVTTASSSQCTSSNNNSDDDLGSLDDLVDILDEALN
ncbi:hypothetical protein INT48_006184 [Thamnidium elegans]|uniref:RNA polymerase II subunit A C-terminal domain phosphatase n=1 Tax=Thamnidium elegans TaxID=101142 RepID=A0A8H7SMX7_9FUNG|nr:hypothetical protein INT48_006184 [Thamnidium elegans]